MTAQAAMLDQNMVPQAAVQEDMSLQEAPSQKPEARGPRSRRGGSKRHQRPLGKETGHGLDASSSQTPEERRGSGLDDFFCASTR